MTWSMQSLSDLATGYWASSVLSTAVKLSLFPAVEGSGASATDVATKLETSPRHTEILLNALVSLDLLTREDGLYRIEESARSFLETSSPTCILGALRYNIDLYPLWGNLDTCLTTGKPVIPLDAHLGNDPDRTRNFAMGMHSRGLAMAPVLIPALDMSGRSRLLDVACGPATFTRFLLEKYPDMTASAFDLPPILAVAKELSQSHPCGDRLDFHPGSYLEDTLPLGYDAAMYCGALHQENHESASNVFRMMHDSLNPGGRAYVVDLMTDDAGTAPSMSLLFSLNMLLTSPRGQVFSDTETIQLMETCGFTNLERTEAPGSPYWIVTGDKA